MFPNRGSPQSQGGGGPQGSVTALAMVCGFAAAFLWAPVLFDKTVPAFRRIAEQNYGRDYVDLMSTAYFIALHPAVFFTARLAVELAATAVIAAVGYRLAF